MENSETIVTPEMLTFLSLSEEGEIYLFIFLHFGIWLHDCNASYSKNCTLFIYLLYPCREIPLELRQRSRGGQVNLDMEDHRDEDFVRPKIAFRAFGGEGQKLGR